MAYGIKYSIRTNEKGSVLSMENSANTFILTKSAIERALVGEPLVVQYLISGTSAGTCLVRGLEAFQIARMYDKQQFDDAVMQLFPIIIEQIKKADQHSKNSIQKFTKKSTYKFQLN